MIWYNYMWRDEFTNPLVYCGQCSQSFTSDPRRQPKEGPGREAFRVRDDFKEGGVRAWPVCCSGLPGKQGLRNQELGDVV